MSDYAYAKRLADNLLFELSPVCQRIEIAGGVRRQKAECKETTDKHESKHGVPARHAPHAAERNGKNYGARRDAGRADYP